MPLPFAVQASAGCPTHADLTLALAAEFGQVDLAAVDGALDALAADLCGARGLAPREQIAALGSLLGAFAPADVQADPRVLMLDAVVERFEGAQVLLAVVACEAARRAGLPVGVIGDGRRHLVGHCATAEPLALDPAHRGGPRGAEEVEGLMWRCSHQVAFAVLRDLVDCSLRGGDLARALRAAELRLTLPLGPDALDVLRAELTALRARLN